jgi:hypothetical protein
MPALHALPITVAPSACVNVTLRIKHRVPEGAT